MYTVTACTVSVFSDLFTDKKQTSLTAPRAICTCRAT